MSPQAGSLREDGNSAKMSRISPSSIQEVLNRMDAVAVAEEYLRLEKRGGRFWGRCPFHAGGQERTPSFTVEPDRKMYYCFGCRKGGSILDFVMEMDKLTFPEAIQNLARKLSVELVYEGAADSDSQSRNDREAENRRREELYELYRRTALTFRHFLQEKAEGKPALDYLFSRNISGEMIERFRLGFSPSDRNWLYGFLQKKGYSAGFLDSSGLFSANYRGSAFFSGRLMFPITDRQGRVVSFGGRAMPGSVQSDGKEPPKYINNRESDTYKKSQVLYGLDLALPEIRQSKTVYIAEGYMDVIALHQAGVTNAVASCGTAFTDDHAKTLRNWADKAVFVFDSDEAGQAAVFKSIITCRKKGLVCFVAVPEKTPGLSAEMKKFKDPAEILQKFGAETLNKVVKNSIIDFEYLVSRGKTLFDIATPRGKSGAVSLFYPYLDALDSKTERNACAEAVAELFRTDRGSVLSDYERWQRQERRGEKNEKPNFEEVSGTEKTIRMNDEIFLLMVVSINTSLYPEFRASIDMREIEDPLAKELFITLEECFINEESGTEALLSRIGSQRLKNFVIKRGISPEFKEDSKRGPRKLMEDGISRIKLKRLRHRRVEVIEELRQREKSSGVGEQDDFQELIVEMQHIDSELRNLEGK